MLSAGKSTITERQLQPPAEKPRVTHDVVATLDERGVEGVQAKAGEYAQAEIQEVHHIAAVRPEDVALAPDEAREIQESASASEKGIEEARQKLMQTISEAVRSVAEALQTQEQSAARRAEDGEVDANAEKEKQSGAALAAEATTDQVAESAAVASVATEARATVNVQTENVAPTVSERASARDEGADVRREDAEPLAEDPAARQQQVTEQGDQPEVVDTGHENPGTSATSPESGTASASEAPPQAEPQAEPVGATPENAKAKSSSTADQPKQERTPQGDPTLEKGFTKEMIGYLRTRAQEAFLHDDPKVRKAGFRKLALATHPDRIIHLDAKAAERAESLLKIVNELGGDNISALQTRISAAESALKDAQNSYDSGEIDAETFSHLKSEHEWVISNAQRDITFDRDRRQGLFDRYRGILDELEAEIPPPAQEPAATTDHTKDESPKADAPPTPDEAAASGKAADSDRTANKDHTAPPSAADQPKQESAPQGDPTLENGFTKEMIGYLRTRAKEAFLHDDPKIRKAGYRKLVLATHPDRLAHLDPKSAERGESLLKIVSDLGGDNISALKIQISAAEAALQEAQKSYDRGDIDAETFSSLKKRSEKIITNAQRDITYDGDRRQALFDRYSAILDEIEADNSAPAPEPEPVPAPDQAKDEPPKADEPVDGKGAAPDKDASQDQAASPDKAADQDQATDQAQPEAPDQTAAPDKAAGPEKPPIPETKETKRKSRGERQGERRKERIASAREACKGAHEAIAKQEKLISDFKLDRGTDNLHAVEVQYLKLMDMALEGLKMEEQIAKLKLEKLEAEDEMAGLLEKQSNATTEEEKAQLQEEIEDLEDEMEGMDDKILGIKESLEILTKKEQLLDKEYRTAVQQMPDTLQGESLLKDEKQQQSTGEKEREVKEEGIKGEKPKDQSPGFGDKVAELWGMAVKTWDDLIK